MIATTTLNKIRDHDPCVEGWAKLRKRLGKTTANDEVITLKIILDSNGLDDALWCLRASDASEFEVRKFARLCAQDVLHLWNAPEVVKQYLETGDESVRENAWDAARAARAVAWDAARATRAVAWDAARATYAAANAAADAAADAAARATWDAARATRAVAWDAARATWDAARGDQTARFISMFCEE